MPRGEMCLEIMTVFENLLAQVPEIFAKKADIESPDEHQLEMDFSNIAFAFLQDRAPAMLSFLLGFEVVDREEDGSKAVGIFGFKVGEDYYYVPAFFTNGQVRGMDLLFSKRTNSFVPLREPWINYILNRQAITLGDSVAGQSVQRDFEQPNFDFAARSPSTKWADYPEISEVMDNACGVWNDLQKAAGDMLDSDDVFREAYACAIARMSGKELPIEKSAGDLGAWLCATGGLKAAAALVDRVEKEPKFAQAIMDLHGSLAALVDPITISGIAELADTEKLAIITETSSNMNSDDRRRILRDGFVVNDNRTNKSESYTMDYFRTYSNPDIPGAYNMLRRDGKVVKVWIFTSVRGMGGLVLVEPTHRFYTTAEPGAVLVEGENDPEFENMYGAAGTTGRMRKNLKYMLVDARGNSTPPFRVRDVISEPGERKRVRVNFETSIRHKGRRDAVGDFSGSDPVPSMDAVEYLALADHSGPLSMSGNKLVVPCDWKALRLNGAYDTAGSLDDSDSPRRKELQEEEQRFVPGDMLDLDELLEKRAVHRLEIKDDGAEYHFVWDGSREGPFGYKTAALRLIRDYGLDGDEAVDMLHKAADGQRVDRLVKLAQGVGVAMPSPPPQSTGYDSYTGVPIEYGQTDVLQGRSVGMPKTRGGLEEGRGMNIGGQSARELQADPEAMDLAMQAAQAGQRQVFDHAAIGGLTKLYDASAVIDSYVPEMSKALDRLGRILFIFYWKNEEFSERYGAEDMTEMEDMLRGVFKSFGDLVLKLKQKSVDAEDGLGTLTGD